MLPHEWLSNNSGRDPWASYLSSQNLTLLISSVPPPSDEVLKGQNKTASVSALHATRHMSNAINPQPSNPNTTAHRERSWEPRGEKREQGASQGGKLSSWGRKDWKEEKIPHHT